MRTIFFFVLLLFCHLHIEAKEGKPPTVTEVKEKKRPAVCLNMIVKDESEVICRCLESVKPLIDYWIIVDTGSKDGTQEIIKKFMKGIPGELHERPWVNFAHNRNEALSLAEDKADYLLFIDADDKLEIAKDFVMPKLDKDCYRLKIQYGGSRYERPHLIKTGLDWKWEGVVHEALVSERMAQTWGYLDGVTMIIVGGGDRSSDLKKFEKDAQALEEALRKDPNHARNVFYLAQSYKDAQMFDLALKNYERRVAMGGWNEEVFWSLYQIGIIQETLNMPEETVSKSYARAFHYMPTRAEPLYRLAAYYRLKDNFLMGYVLSQFALNVQDPKEGLFIEAWIYDYGVLLEHSINSYWVGHYDESFKSCNALLLKSDLPEHVRECTHKNMSFVLPKIAEQKRAIFAKKAG